MRFNELDAVVLTVDLPEFGLHKGDIGTIVDVHPAGDAYEVEFNGSRGTCLALETLTGAQIRALKPGEASVRRVVEAAA